MTVTASESTECCGFFGVASTEDPRMEVISSRLEAIATKSKKLRASLLGARTLLGAPGLTTRSKDATRLEAILGFFGRSEAWRC